MTLDYAEYSQIDEESHTNSGDVESDGTSVFSAKAFVDDLLENGTKTPCDQTLEEFDGNEIPKFYDANKFKMGQSFFRKHILSIFLSKFLGLVVTLSSPSILAILQMTKMSSSKMTAYRRYTATILHMNIWYETELSPNSRSMNSIKKVKAMHNSASMKSRNIESIPITQMDMVLTQFGFMGFSIARSENMGIHNATKEELEGFVHFWRVIGSIMGIQDRFNLCRESLDETKEICEELINRVFYPLLQKKEKKFLQMTSYMINGLWYIFPNLNFRVFLTYLYDIVKPNPNECSNNNDFIEGDKYFDLTLSERLLYKRICYATYMLRYDFVRIFLNFLHHLTIWIVHRYPFLAVYAFGYKNAMVFVEQNQVKSHVN